MFQSNFFSALHAKYKTFGKKRIELMKLSGDILRFSKQMIFSLHRNDMAAGKSFLAQSEKLLKKADDLLRDDYHLESEGNYKAATEEFVEAKLFYDFLLKKKINFYEKYKIGTDEYIGGLADFTGELVRRSILEATKRNDPEVKRIHEVIDLVVMKLSEFHVAGKNRQKFDDAKRNLKKVEEILYDLEIRRRN